MKFKIFIVRTHFSLKLLHTAQIVFFCDEKLAQKEIIPPYIPTFDPDDTDLISNFDPQFTREPADLTLDDP